jgi:hypothetical protein
VGEDAVESRSSLVQGGFSERVAATDGSLVGQHHSGVDIGREGTSHVGAAGGSHV